MIWTIWGPILGPIWDWFRIIWGPCLGQFCYKLFIGLPVQFCYILLIPSIPKVSGSWVSRVTHMSVHGILDKNTPRRKEFPLATIVVIRLWSLTSTSLKTNQAKGWGTSHGLVVFARFNTIESYQPDKQIVLLCVLLSLYLCWYINICFGQYKKYYPFSICLVSFSSHFDPFSPHFETCSSRFDPCSSRIVPFSSRFDTFL